MDNSTNKSETRTIRSALRTFRLRVHTISGHSNDNNPYFSGKIIAIVLTPGLKEEEYVILNAYYLRMLS